MRRLPKALDLSLYFIADPVCCGGRDVADVVRAAVKAGVTLVQYRDKSNARDQIFRNAKILGEICATAGVPLLLNDHVDIAAEAGLDGVHIGQGDMAVAAARALLRPDAIVGLTAFTESQIVAVDAGAVDYIGTGPVYPTLTDKGKPVLGVQRFAQLAALSPVPVVGIGGITPENAGAVREAGADGIAVMRGIGAAADINAAVKLFQKI